MKLTYKILWLDDKIDELFIDDEYDKEITTYLINQGFNPQLETVSTQEDFFSKLDDSFDLILTDFNLKEKKGQTLDGDVIVKEIRNKSIYTEILFYSAYGQIEDLKNLDRITFVDTKTSKDTHQETVLKSLIRLIDLTIKKFQHIVSMRGMIMNETCSLDSQMLEIIKIALDDKNLNFDTLSSNIYSQLNRLFEEKLKFVKKCEENGKFNKLTKDDFVFSADYKIQTLSEIIKILGLDDFTSDYKERINLIRNKFAHAILLKDEHGKEYFKYGESGIEFNEDLCKKIRIDLNIHQKNLNDLLSVLKENITM